MEDLISRIIKRIAELPDRTSPDDWPEAMLVTSGELDLILREELDEPTPTTFRDGSHDWRCCSCRSCVRYRLEQRLSQ